MIKIRNPKSSCTYKKAGKSLNGCDDNDALLYIQIKPGLFSAFLALKISFSLFHS